MYDELKGRENPFEIVFISMDKTKEEMMEYYKETHGDWLALKYDDPLKDTLTEKYKVSIIPKLVVIRPDGEVITAKGRKDVQDKGLISFRGWHSSMLAAAKKADQQQQQLLEMMEAENNVTEEAID
nr:hypothetical protein BaRGS_029869 [Batillaria attramentaria]